MNRKAAPGYEEGEYDAFLPEQAIDLATSLTAYTAGSAWVNHLDADTGTIEVGKYADLAVLDRDPFDGSGRSDRRDAGAADVRRGRRASTRRPTPDLTRPRQPVRTVGQVPTAATRVRGTRPRRMESTERQGSDTRGHDRLRTTAAGSIRHPSEPRGRRDRACSGSTTSARVRARPRLTGTVHGRPRDRRRRLHRPLDRAARRSGATPSARVVIVEARTVGWAASGRNGGFCEASLTHGHDNGLSRWPDEIDQPRPARHGEPRRAWAKTSPRTASTPTGSASAASPSRPSRTSSSGSTSGRRMPRPAATRASCG